MGHHADHVRPPDLRPQHGLHVVAELGDGESGEPVHAARDALDVSLLGELARA